MTPAGVQALMLHIQMHKAYAYGTTESPMMGQMIGQVGNPVMAPAPGHVLMSAPIGGGSSANGGPMGGGSDVGADSSSAGQGGSVSGSGSNNRKAGA
jgi:hypothetical protein